MCNNCKYSTATHLHSYALCPKIDSFWFDVFDIMSKVLGVTIKSEPLLVIFGVSESFKNLNKAQQCFISNDSKKKNTEPDIMEECTPSSKMWLEELTSIRHLERIRLKDRLQHVETTWQPLKQYLANTNPTS